MNAALRQAHTEAQAGTGALGTAAKDAWRVSVKAALAAAEAKDAAARQAAQEAAGSTGRGTAAEEEALKLLQAQLAAVASDSRSAKRSREAAGSDESSGEEDGGGDADAAGDGEGTADGGVTGRAARALGWEDAEPSAAQEAAATEAAALWKPGTAEEQLERLTGPLARWRCLNPFGVLQLDENGPPALANARFKKLSTLVHPDKHPLDEDRARAAFEAVKAAAEAIKDEEKRSWARRLVRQGKRKAARLTRRARRAQPGSAGSSSAAAEAAAAREAEAREVLKAFAAAEHRRRTLEDSLRKEAQADAMEVDEELAAMKRERNADTMWAGERTDRVDSWRRFQGSAAAGKGLKRDKVSTFGGKAAAEVAASAGDGTSEFKSTWR
jgi:hypothetical protein